MSQHPPSPTPLPVPGVSGKRLTWIVLLSLAAVGGGISYTLWTFNRLEIVREETRQAWREVTEQLGPRYRAALEYLAQNAATRQATNAVDAQFQQAVDRFRTTSLPREQQAVARELEAMLAQDDFLPAKTPDLVASPQLHTALDNYNERLQQEQQMHHSLGGRLLGIFLNFPQSLPFQVAE